MRIAVCSSKMQRGPVSYRVSHRVLYTFFVASQSMRDRKSAQTRRDIREQLAPPSGLGLEPIEQRNSER